MRLRFKIPLALAIILIIIIGSVVIIVYKSDLIENRVNRYLAEKIAEQYGLEIIVGEISGSFIDGVVLHDVQLLYVTPPDTLSLAYLPLIKINYQFSNIWNKKWVLDSVYFEQPRIHLVKDSLNGWRLPHLGKADDGGNNEPVELPSWEIGQLVIDRGEVRIDVDRDSVEVSEISLEASVKSEEKTHTVKLERLECFAPRKNFRLKRASGLATIHGKDIVLQDIKLESDSSQLDVSGTISSDKNKPQYDMIIDKAHLNLSKIIELLFHKKIDGNLDVSGNFMKQDRRIGANLVVSGDFQNRKFDSLLTRFHVVDKMFYFDTISGYMLNGCRVDGYGELDLDAKPEGFQVALAIQDFDLKNLVFNSFSSDLNGNLILSGRGLRGSDMALDLNVDLEESHFDIYHFHKGRGQMTITTDGLYLFPGFSIEYYENRFLCEGDIDYKGELSLKGRADLPNLERFTGQTFIDLPAGRGQANFAITGATSDPNLSGTFVSDSVWFYQFYSPDFSADFDIARFTTGKRGSITVTARSGEAWQFPYDSISAWMNLDSTLLVLDSIQLGNKFSWIETSGSLDYGLYPQLLTMNELALNLSDRWFHNHGQLAVWVDSSGFIFDNINLAAVEGNISLNGRANYDESLDLSWNIERAEIQPWVAMMNDTLDVTGKLSSRGEISGPFQNPSFTSEIMIDSLAYHNLSLGDFQGYLTYRDSVLSLDSTYLESSEGVYRAEGTLPIDLSLARVDDRLSNKNQKIRIMAADNSLDLAAFLMPSVEYLYGDFTAEIELTGTARQPHLNGLFEIKKGRAKLYDLQDELTRLSLKMVMADQLIKIESASAEMPRPKSAPGKITAQGSIFVNDINSLTYNNLRAVATKIPVNYELGDFKGVASADVTVNGTTPPTVTGTITLHSATYGEEFTSEESGFSVLSALESDQTWNLDLMVEMPNNFWVKNQDLSAEFSGRLNIIRRDAKYNFLGEMEIIRGKYFMIDRSFDFEPDGVINFNNIEKPDPELDLYMTTQVRGRSNYADFESETGYSFDFTLHITGPLSNPTISSPDGNISAEDILPLLYRGSAGNYNEGATDNAEVVTSRLEGVLAGQFARLGTRTLGVETFEIHSLGRAFDPASTRLTIGAYTLPNLYVYGSSYFAVDRGQKVGFEYRLGSHYIFEGLRDEKNLYHANFKLFWDY